MHALVGENGAGKSTLGRIVAGALAPDRGRMLLDGKEVSFRSPREALEHGVVAIAQESSIVPHLTVAQNVFLGAEPNGAGFIRRRRLDRDYAALAESAGFDLPGRDVGRAAAHVRAAEGRDPARALARRAADRDGRADRRARRAGDAPPARDRPPARRRRDDGPPHLALPPRGARARRHGHRAPRRPHREDGADGGGDRGVARRGDARPAAHLDLPAEEPRPPADAPVVLSVRDLSRARRRRRRASSSAPARSSASPGSSAPGAPSWRGPSSARRRSSRARSCSAAARGSAAARAAASARGSR